MTWALLPSFVGRKQREHFDSKALRLQCELMKCVFGSTRFPLQGTKKELIFGDLRLGSRDSEANQAHPCSQALAQEFRRAKCV